MKFDLSKKISPKENFYLYVNKNWIDKTTIPKDKNRWSTFDILNEDNFKKIKLMFESKSLNIESNMVKILYNQYMDIKRNKIKPKTHFKSFLNNINKINNKDDLLLFIYREFVLNGIDSPINFSVFSDFNNSNFNILHISGGGIGLPDKSYYFDEEFKSIRNKYKIFIKDYLKLFDLEYNSDEILDLEKKLAKTMFSNVEKRDPILMNNTYTFNSINKAYPLLKLNSFFDLISKKTGKINIINKRYFDSKDGFINLWNKKPIQLWKEYLTYIYLRQVGQYANIKTEKVIFDFYEKELGGIKELKLKWKRGIQFTESYLGSLVGKMYVEKYFNVNSKEKVIEMISFIKSVFKNRLKKNNWMEEKTKLKAIKKLDNVNFKIGFPKRWRSFKLLNINNESSLIENILKCMRFETKYNNNFLYKNVDKDLWFMDAHNVNAYYSPNFNEMVFPAGILQKPFFSLENDISSNFGAIGMVIAHELTHGFDDQGKKYDLNGNLNEWWSKKDNINYKKNTNKLSKLFSSYKIFDKNINGDLTLGENIADLGGLTISLDALKDYYDYYPNENINKNNLSPYETFFINYANIWKSKVRKKYALQKLITDPHSPPEFRVNGILIHIDDFYKTFNIKNNDKMSINEKKKISIF